MTDSIPPLRAMAEEAGMTFGAAVAGQKLEDPRFRETFVRQFNGLVAERAMKCGPIHPERNRYHWEEADALVDLAEKYGMKTRGHTLLWHTNNPKWLEEGKFSRDELLAIMREHILAVAGRYKGRIFQWDVVNEGISDNPDGSLRHTLWHDGVGTDYLEHAFRFAHEADPGAALFYNDYGAEEINVKSNAIYELLSDFKRRGVPVHGMGFQCHVDNPPPPSMEENFNRFRDLGLEIAVTELDVRCLLPATEESLARQAEIYRDHLRIFHRCGGRVFMLWGVNDHYSWVQGFFKGFGAALPFDDEFKPKPAYHALSEELRSLARAD